MWAKRERFLKPGTSGMPIIFEASGKGQEIYEKMVSELYSQVCLFHSF